MSSYDCLDLCRLCLVKDRVSVPIFEGEGDVRQIFLKITACLPVKVAREDKLPKKICDDCVYKVELLYEFWNTTANAEKQLLQWLGDVGMEDKRGYVSSVMNSELMKQETVENRLDGTVMQTEEHQNNMGINMMDQMGLTMPIIMSTDQQQMTSVSMASSGNNIQAVPGTSTQSSQRGRKSGNNDDDDEEESEEEDNTDDECDNEEGLSVKEESTVSNTTGRSHEPAFVNVSIPCDEAGPSGLQQQQKISDLPEMVMTQTADGDPKSGFQFSRGHFCIKCSMKFSSRELLLRHETASHYHEKKYRGIQSNANESSTIIQLSEDIKEEPLDNRECEFDQVLVVAQQEGEKDDHDDDDDEMFEGILRISDDEDERKYRIDEFTDKNQINHPNPLQLSERNQDLEDNPMDKFEVVTEDENLDDMFEEVTDEDNPENMFEEVLTDEEEERIVEEALDEELFEELEGESLQLPVKSSSEKPQDKKSSMEIYRITLRPKKPTCKMFQCDLCDWSCAKMSTWYAHKRNHRAETENITYYCNDCTFKTSKKASLSCHIWKKHKTLEPEIFSCGQCDYKNKNKYELKVHITRKHTNDFKFSCEICSKKFKVKGDLTNHIRFSHREQPVICDVCGKTCMNSNSLYVHQKFAHYKAKFECKICKRRMVSQDNLNEHMLRQHEKKEKAVCKECGKTFSRNSRLKIHMRIHTGDKPYGCHVCTKAFARRTALKQHLLIHTGIRPYVCDICGKAFTQKPGLISHRKSHPGQHAPLPRVMIDHILNHVMNN